MTNNDSTLSKTITFLRFPLIVAVVFIHTNLTDVKIDGVQVVNEGDFPIHNLLQHIISNELARIAVPLFFFISGFLFFYRTDFSLHTYGTKLKKRIHTLLIPYLFWNLLLFLKEIFNQFVRHKIPLESKPIADYDWTDFLNVFWVYNSPDSTMPLDYPLWFIRDLMIVCLFTPILYWFIKHCKMYGIFILGGLWLIGLWSGLANLRMTAFFFFSFGAWYSINRRDFTVSFLPLRWTSTFLYAILVVLSTYLWHNGTIDYSFAHKLGIVVGIITAVSWTAYGINKGRLYASAFLAGSAFLIYAFHILLLGPMQFRWMKYLPINECTMIAGYLLLPLLTTVICVGIYVLLRRYFPAFTAIITGGR